ncbi:Secreted subtilisin-like serine protease sub5 [Ophidiomyces ophidiicola]|nr:Secreted subtilisin-like serine protease sub5 [Ophidiomyces ophidiicola]
MGFSKVLFLAAVSAVNAADILAASRPQDVIADQYIVVMKNDVSAESFSSHRSWVADMHHSDLTKRSLVGHGIKRTYDFHSMKGYSGVFDKKTIKEIAKNPNVAFIEPDQVVKLNDLVEQPNAPTWGLGRISNKRVGISNYFYDSSAGEGIWAYDVDTGVDISHPEFEGRAIWGSNHVDKDDTDGHGHGTHVGGTIGSKTYGVAKKAKIIAVKVLSASGSGSNSGVIAGIDWSVNHARQANMISKSVMNLSLGGGRSDATNMAVANAFKAGMHVAVAAGNDNRDARNSSPASEPLVCTVAASDIRDNKASFSNFGSVVDIYAPGDTILSLRPGGGTRTLSGTSMAAPHIAGLGAYLMALEGIPANQACDRIKALSQGVIRNPGAQTTNKLAYNNSGK